MNDIPTRLAIIQMCRVSLRHGRPLIKIAEICTHSTDQPSDVDRQSEIADPIDEAALAEVMRGRAAQRCLRTNENHRGEPDPGRDRWAGSLLAGRI